MLLAQVKLDMSLGMRRVYRCRDKQGKEFTIAFYYDNGVVSDERFEDIIRGFSQNQSTTSADIICSRSTLFSPYPKFPLGTPSA